MNHFALMLLKTKGIVLKENDDAYEMTKPELDRFLSDMEKLLPTSARYKSVDYDMRKHWIEWVTQSTDKAGSTRAATAIAREMTKLKWTGWTVKVVCRYDVQAEGKTPWSIKVS